MVLYCSSCAHAGRMVPPFPATFSPSSYQDSKEHKHTTVASMQGWLGVFTFTGSETYWDYVIEPLASGCLRVDGPNNKTFTVVASRQVGITHRSGRYYAPADAVKLVWPVNSSKVHPYPVPTTLLNSGGCAQCGAHVLY